MEQQEWLKPDKDEKYYEKQTEIWEVTQGLLPESIYAREIGSSTDRAVIQAVLHIEKRLNDIEDRIFRTAKKNNTTRAQQMLILYHLGLLDRINELDITKKKKAKLLSILLNASADNIEGDLTYSQKGLSDLRTKENYAFLVDTFKEVGLHEISEDADKILDKINQEK